MGSAAQPVPADHPVHYERHRPEHTLLYQLVEAYYPAFKAHLEAQGTALPHYVVQEFEDYLKCGRLEHGFMRHLPVPHPTGDLRSCKSAFLPICQRFGSALTKSPGAILNSRRLAPKG
ncbi:MAG: hypothetical protein ABFR65_08660, partial [Pseudomonadota bacterium]